MGGVREDFLAEQIGEGKDFAQFCLCLKLLPTGHDGPFADNILSKNIDDQTIGNTKG